MTLLDAMFAGPDHDNAYTFSRTYEWRIVVHEADEDLPYIALLWKNGHPMNAYDSEDEVLWSICTAEECKPEELHKPKV